MALSIPFNAHVARHARTAPVKTTVPVRKPGLWTRFLNALIESQQRRAEREIERLIYASGGRLTDSVERDIERLLSGHSFR